jgi:REP element-mobilizing transposase RayT
MRLAYFDYSGPGAYFVTICAAWRGSVFGRVREGVRLNECGRLVVDALSTIPDHHDVEIDTSIVMPDHVHAIVVLSSGARREPLSAVVGAFKARVARHLRRAVWQRSFYDHVIRDDADLERVREYIETNPLRWSLRERAEGPGPDRSGPYDDVGW